MTKKLFRKQLSKTDIVEKRLAILLTSCGLSTLTSTLARLVSKWRIC
ncbi:hypothetical protein CCACVL1_00319 [Corchorus capsularis]|uniref:Uncharacterized protein n=1 Tax=Corchorus capsularis TaxID=210143 RepID=A0A1R3KXA0_COCAP|nr:hypothetical protein CCACVL1_00319 [Corchorus capsularis]